MGGQNRNKQSGTNLSLTIEDLMGKQSVRATFRLPQQTIDLLSVIAGQLGIKQKSLFDQLIEDTSVLKQVAKEAQQYSSDSEDTRQKTFVISRSSLLSLNYIAKQQKIPRGWWHRNDRSTIACPAMHPSEAHQTPLRA